MARVWGSSSLAQRQLGSLNRISTLVSKIGRSSTKRQSLGIRSFRNRSLSRPLIYPNLRPHMATALSTIVRTFVLHLTLGRGDGGYDLNLLFPSRNQQPPFPKGEEKTDSEPEDMHNDDDFWTGLGKNNATPGVSARRDRDGTTDDSPMDVGVGVSTAQPGDSAELPTPNPFYQGPHSKDLALVLEVVPDVLPEHALELIKQRHLLYGDLVVEVVVQGLLDHPSYPKAKIDFASVDRPQPTGRNYRTSALVRSLLPVDHTLSAPI